MTDMEKLNAEELDQVAGGKGKDSTTFWTDAVVFGTTHYLALRSRPEHDDSNEIGKAKNGDVIQICPDVKAGNFVWAACGKKQGWVTAKFVQPIKRYR